MFAACSRRRTRAATRSSADRYAIVAGVARADSSHRARAAARRLMTLLSVSSRARDSQSLVRAARPETWATRRLERRQARQARQARQECGLKPGQRANLGKERLRCSGGSGRVSPLAWDHADQGHLTGTRWRCFHPASGRDAAPAHAGDGPSPADSSRREIAAIPEGRWRTRAPPPRARRGRVRSVRDRAAGGHGRNGDASIARSIA